LWTNKRDVEFLFRLPFIAARAMILLRLLWRPALLFTAWGR
jgi:hypothetical protein